MTVTAPEFTAADVYKARFTEGLSWNEMRAKFGVKWNSTRFYAAMVPHARRKTVLAKHAADGAKPCEALVRAVAASQVDARAYQGPQVGGRDTALPGANAWERRTLIPNPRRCRTLVDRPPGRCAAR